MVVSLLLFFFFCFVLFAVVLVVNIYVIGMGMTAS